MIRSTQLADTPDPTSNQTVVVPAYNEAFRIESTLRTILSYLERQPYQSEVLLVDDGSSDRTADSAERLVQSYPQLTVIRAPHGGKAAAVLRGLSLAQGDLILFTDADLATPIDYLEGFRKKAIEGADVVIGSREGASAARIGEPAFRHLMGRGFNALVRALVLPGIQDTQCGFKLFRSSARDAILPRLQLYGIEGDPIDVPKVTAFDVELLVVARRLGLRIDVVPVTWTFGERSKVDPLGDTMTNLGDVLKVKWNLLRGNYG